MNLDSIFILIYNILNFGMKPKRFPIKSNEYTKWQFLQSRNANYMDTSVILIQIPHVSIYMFPKQLQEIFPYTSLVFRDIVHPKLEKKIKLIKWFSCLTPTKTSKAEKKPKAVKAKPRQGTTTNDMDLNNGQSWKK